MLRNQSLPFVFEALLDTPFAILLRLASDNSNKSRAPRAGTGRAPWFIPGIFSALLCKACLRVDMVNDCEKCYGIGFNERNSDLFQCNVILEWCITFNIKEM